MKALKKLILDNYKSRNNLLKALKDNDITLELSNSDYSSAIIKQDNKKYHYQIIEFGIIYNTLHLTKLDKPVIKMRAIKNED